LAQKNGLGKEESSANVRELKTSQAPPWNMVELPAQTARVSVFGDERKERFTRKEEDRSKIAKALRTNANQYKRQLRKKKRETYARRAAQGDFAGWGVGKATPACRQRDLAS